MNGVAYLIYFLIAVFAVVALGCYITAVKDINKINRDIDEKKKKKTKIKYTQGGIQTISDADTWEETYETMKDFSKPRVTYSMASQLIPIFPLLGILGTVVGLMLQLKAGSIEALKDSLGTSMGTTLAGLLAAILLKLVDALWAGRKVTELEIRFDMYEQDYQMSRDRFEQDENNAE